MGLLVFDVFNHGRLIWFADGKGSVSLLPGEFPFFWKCLVNPFWWWTLDGLHKFWNGHCLWHVWVKMKMIWHWIDGEQATLCFSDDPAGVFVQPKFQCLFLVFLVQSDKTSRPKWSLRSIAKKHRHARAKWYPQAFAGEAVLKSSLQGMKKSKKLQKISIFQNFSPRNPSTNHELGVLAEKRAGYEATFVQVWR